MAGGEGVVLDQLPLLATAPVSSETITVAEANALLVAWEHRLGPLNRPFSQRAYALLVDGRPMSLAMSASAVSAAVQVEPDVRGETGEVVLCGLRLRRDQVVELARLCSAPGQAWASRVMIRLWREVFAQRWPDWRVEAAISYSQNAHHRGDLYRFDGWDRVRTDAGHPPGKTATWAKYGVDHPARGQKSLWAWRYPS